MVADRQRDWSNSGSKARPPLWTRASLTAAQRQEIRQRLADGERAVDLAAEYGVSRGCINNYR